jgi:hypothetical protein
VVAIKRSLEHYMYVFFLRQVSLCSLFDLEFAIFLLQPFKGWDYMPPFLAEH